MTTRTDQLVACPRCQDLRGGLPLSWGCLLCTGQFAGTGRPTDQLGGLAGLVPASLAAAYQLLAEPPSEPPTEEQIRHLRARFRS